MTDKTLTPPLLDVFETLRSYEFALGISDYLLLQKALSRGLGVGSRDDLIYLCQSLWGKSESQQQQIRHVLEATLPHRITDEDLEKLRQSQPDDEPEPGDDSIEGPTDTGGAGDAARQRDRRSAQKPRAGDGDAQRQHTQAAQMPDWALTRGGAGFGLRSEFADDDLPPGVANCEGFNFEGRLPIPLRQIQRIWSYLRRMRAEGPSVILDAEATIEDIHRKGILEAPIMVPRRVNRAKLLILRDEGESMAPFQRVIEPLIDAARSSGLSEVRTLSFRNELSENLFPDSSRGSPVNMAQLIKDMRGASMLVVSDGGVMRERGPGHQSANNSCRFLRKYREFWPNRAWLNPTPVSRWANTAAMTIRRRTPIAMYEYDKIGLSAAVERLRGKLAIVQR